MSKENALISWMREEALAAAECAACQVNADEDRYGELASRLTSRAPAAAVTIARGSSDHAAGYFAYLSLVRGGHLVTSLPMSSVTLYRAPISARDLLVVSMSQSGRSPDLCMPVERFRAGGATTVAFVNETSSPLAGAAEWVMPLHAGTERSVAATKSFICSLVAGARLVANWSADSELMSAVRELPEALRSACGQDWSGALDVLRDAQRIMVIGRGTGLAVAQEAALKFKETCGIQAEAFSSAEVKHGPMALVEAGYPMLVFAPRGPAQADLLALSRDMRERGARVLLAAPADVGERQLTLSKAMTPDLDPVAAIQSFYLMVEALARSRGFDPDTPRHLQKVTSTL
jgi:glucosamine--fructose-6-phosphate aminotransferase (isomerizing)